MTPPPVPEELRKWPASPKSRAHQSIIAISSSVHAGLLVHYVCSQYTRVRQEWVPYVVR